VLHFKFSFIRSHRLLRFVFLMSDANSDLPPRSQTRSSSLRGRMSRSSTTNRILHRTLPSQSPSPSTIGHRRRKSSTRE
jgi:hypothetical protein